MLTIKKTSFPYRAWMAVRKNMPEPFCNDQVIEKRLQTMNLCRFFWCIVIGAVLIGSSNVAFAFLALASAASIWPLALIALLVLLTFGFYPTGGVERVTNAIRDEDNPLPVSRLVMVALILGMWVPLTFLGIDETNVLRRYPTLKIANRAIYPWHLIVPAALCWIGSMFVDACRTDPQFAQSAANAAWVIVILGAVIGLVFGAVALSKSETGKLLRAYLKAKKQRVCPMIEFVDDTETITPPLDKLGE